MNERYRRLIYSALYSDPPFAGDQRLTKWGEKQRAGVLQRAGRCKGRSATLPKLYALSYSGPSSAISSHEGTSKIMRCKQSLNLRWLSTVWENVTSLILLSNSCLSICSIPLFVRPYDTTNEVIYL